MLIRRLIVSSALAFSTLAFQSPEAKASQCDYPGVGIGVNVLGINGVFCDFPTEINGSHWHCEEGGVRLGIGAGSGLSGEIAGLNVAGVGQGIDGESCSWRCPDGVMAPPPNPPGAWKSYLVPMNTTNWCKDHMTPNGFWSAPVLPTEGLPEGNAGVFLPNGQPPPPPAPPPPDGTAPGEPREGAIQPNP